ncbi:hypothetical protein ACVBEG_26830 [Pseudomonas sp. GG8]
MSFTDQVYDQDFVGSAASQPVGPETRPPTAIFVVSGDQGLARGGNIDNKSFNGIVSYSLTC